MSLPENDKWLNWAERIDAMRVIPRIIITVYYLFFIKAWYFVVTWFMAFDWSGIDNEAVALAIAGFPAVILGVLTGVLSTLTKNYWAGGRKWNGTHEGET